MKQYKESNPEFKTIGEHYSDIIDELWDLSDIEKQINQNSADQKLFTGDPRKQFEYIGDLGTMNVVKIEDLRSALNQLREIVEEGQGGSIFKLNGIMNVKSQFIRFLELYTECEITDITSKTEKDQTTIYYSLK